MESTNYFAEALKEKRKNKPGAGRPKQAPTVTLYRRIRWDRLDRIAIIVDLLKDNDELLGAIEAHIQELSQNPNQ